MNYTDLKNSINAYMHRDDLEPVLDTFIDLFEARASRKLRTIQMEKTATVTGGASVALPTGFQEMRTVQIQQTPPRLLEYASPQKIAALGITGGTTKYYTIAGNVVEFSPSAAGSTVLWTYYTDIPALSASAPTNWLIEKHPDYYLFGCIHQALEYVMDPTAATMEQRVLNYEAEINKASRRSMSGPMVISGV